MSTFAVTIERISEVWEHTNADRLEMARLVSMSYQFVIAKGSYRPGDLVIYFPIDSLLPAPVIETLGLTGKLSGPQQNRVKTVKLRGAISQGIVTSPQDVLPDGNFVEGQDITELLGVTKYEPPVVAGAGGNLIALPPLVSIYDIEGAERFTAQVEKYLLDVPVMVTEKLEGSHFAASISADGIAVCQRRFRIDPIDSVEHDWHKAARKSGLLEKLPALKAEIEQRFDHPVQVVTVRGEMIGPSIQGNHYRLPTQVLRIFEIEADGIPLEVQPYLDLVAQFQLDTVPLLVFGVTLREWLAGQTLSQASNGLSILNPDVVREGVVIRPLLEMRDEDLGRVIIKQRSPVYLAGSDY